MPDQLQPAPPERKEFWRGVFSDSGEPSSSRVLTVVLSTGNLGLLTTIVVHLIRLHDPAQLSLWLTALPGIVLGLVGFSSAPYAMNRASGSITDILASLRK
ncbi:MAG: hypothetical protein ACLGXA_24510 [Acidobacteriota bacterium]